MLKIKSELFTFNGKQSDYIDFLSDLNNYKNLFPKDKIKNWKSEENFCEFNLQNAYTLEILKESVSENIVFLKSGNKSPFSFEIKIEVNEKSNNICSACIESEANVSAVLKTIVGKPLNELFNHMASKIEESIAKD
jgi:hypothetical protein|tara:strand:- start:538 stop:945 length:408 start_codon:yes stop_codon:yes gene_type:complete